MFKLVQLLDDAQVRALRDIAAAGKFVDGRISNPHSKVKNNLQLHDAGAYGASMSSQYNSRPLAPEILIDGDDARVIRRRQTIEDLLLLESMS